MSPNRNGPEAWLDLAHQATAIAYAMHDGGARQTMLEIAMRYERLATRAALALSQQNKAADDVSGLK